MAEMFEEVAEDGIKNDAPVVHKIVLKDGGHYKGELLDNQPHGLGTSIYKDGSSFVGEWEFGEYKKGKKVYDYYNDDRKSFYDGEWKNGKQHGYGKIIYDGFSYEGMWKDGNFHGQGKGVFQDEIYEGEWQDGYPFGQGVFTFKNGDVFTGTISQPFVEDSKNERFQIIYGCFGNSEGTYVYRDGTSYMGEVDIHSLKFKAMNKEAMYYDIPDRFLCIFVSPETCEGTFKFKDEKHGVEEFTGVVRNGSFEKGKGTFANGDVYEGEWTECKPNGEGTMTYADGRVWTGSFKDGERTLTGQWVGGEETVEEYDSTMDRMIVELFGEVTENGMKNDANETPVVRKIVLKDGGHYEGEVFDDQPDGFGTCVYKDGGSFVGEWVFGEYRNGKKTYSDGSSYEGKWKNGKFHGFGKMIYADGRVWSGSFKDGERTLSGHWGEREEGIIKEHDNTTTTETVEEVVENGTKSEANEESAVCKIVLEDGGHYEGELFDDQPEGFGTCVYKDGSSFVGEWAFGEYKKGKKKYSDGSSYDGAWKDGRFHGKGKRIFSGYTYKGEWQDGYPFGKGVFTFKNGDVFTGNTRKGSGYFYRLSKGKYVYKGGASYAGEVWLAIATTPEEGSNEHRFNYVKQCEPENCEGYFKNLTYKTSAFRGTVRKGYPKEGTITYTNGRVWTGRFRKGKRKFFGGRWVNK